MNISEAKKIEVVEPENTLSILRQEYFDKVLQWYMDQELWRKYPTDGQYHYEMFSRCTILQLRAFLRLVGRNEAVELYRCNPADHLAVGFAGMYVGIEPDGYTHS